MRMGEQNLDARGAILLRHQVEPQRPDSGAGVEHDQLAPRACNGDAWRVAAVARGGRPGRWNAAAGSPKRHRVGHASHTPRFGLSYWQLEM